MWLGLRSLSGSTSTHCPNCVGANVAWSKSLPSLNGTWLSNLPMARRICFVLSAYSRADCLFQTSFSSGPIEFHCLATLLTQVRRASCESFLVCSLLWALKKRAYADRAFGAVAAATSLADGRRLLDWCFFRFSLYPAGGLCLPFNRHCKRALEVGIVFNFEGQRENEQLEQR